MTQEEIQSNKPNSINNQHIMDGLEVEQSNYNSGAVKNASSSQIQLNSLGNS